MHELLHAVGPRPHYLTEFSVEGNEVRATAMFPSSDETIGDRGDHANIAHLLFGVWNAAHVLCREHGLRQPLVRSGSFHCSRKTQPDVPVYLHLVCTPGSESARAMAGRYAATYTDEQGRELASMDGSFVAHKA